MGHRKARVQSSYVFVGPRTFALADVEGRKSVPPEEYRNFPAYAYTTQACALEVNPKTGTVKVLQVFAAHDVGRAINPQKIEGQIEGSCLMAQGYALTEDFPVERGLPKARTFHDLKVPTILEAPLIRTLIVEKPDLIGPFGAKGISEVATVPLTPAITNEIYDAVGVRIYDLPATPARILAGMRRM
jgi:CO/xanthine dehydrogenase Mo-binding subunit